MELRSADYGLRPIPPTAEAAGPSHSRLRGRRRSTDRSSIAANSNSVHKNGRKRGCEFQNGPSVHKYGGKTWTATGIAAVVVGVLGLAGAVYVMVNGIGLNPDLDFGAGNFLNDTERTVDTRVVNDGGILSGHGGGDVGLMDNFVQAVAEDNPSLILTGVDETLESHLMVFAAEKSRREGIVCKIE